METEKYYNFEWRIENLSRWRAEVHGNFIPSPRFYIDYCVNLELYPKGIDGQDESLVVRFCGNKYDFSGDVSFYSSNGSVLCEQQVNAKKDMSVIDLPLELELEDVLSGIRESGDFVTLRCRIKYTRFYEQRVCTTINVFKTSIKMNPKWFENITSVGKIVCYIQVSLNDFSKEMQLKACSKNNAVEFAIESPTKNETIYAVEVCFSLRRSDGIVDRCVKKEHVFRDESSWTFIDSLDKTEFVERGISLFLILKITTKDFLHRRYSVNYDYISVSFKPNDIPSFSDSEKESSTDLVTSSKIADSVKVLSEDFMCLYQDQDFSDFQLKCGNVSFPVHKNVLSARSPIFKTMLSTDMTEAASGQVVVEDLDPSTLALFLTFLYTGVVEDLQSDRALKLYYAADKYRVPSLKRECVKFLCSNVSISNVCDILTLADKHRDDELATASHDFILDNFNAVLKSQEWNTFKRSDPLLAVNTVTQLAAENHVVRKPHLQ